MKKLLLVGLLAVLLAGCAGDSIEATQSGDFKLELLFEKNGCKMYRFNDAGRYIYWSDCQGRTAYDYTTHTSTGKTTTSTTHHVESNTNE